MQPVTPKQQIILIGAFFSFVILAMLTLFARPIWEASGTKNPADWLGFAGNLVGTTATLLAAYVAWSAVKFQARVGIVERKAEKIEQELPGMHKASLLMEHLATQLSSGDTSPGIALNVLETFGFKETETRFDTEVEKRLPTTPDRVRRRIAMLIFHLRNSAFHANVSKHRASIIEAQLDGATVESSLTKSYKDALRYHREAFDLHLTEFGEDSRAVVAYAKALEQELLNDIELLNSLKVEIDAFYRSK